MYWIIINDTQQGPYSLEQLGEINLSTNTPVWREGMTEWIPAGQIEELAALIPAPQPPAIPTDAYVEAGGHTPAATIQTIPVATIEPATTIVAGQPTVYAPANAIPAGYVAIAPAGEPVCPPTYLVWAIIATIICFLPMGICAIICATKVKGHFKAGRLEKASRMSERAALFVILSIVAWLIWMPFSIVFAMM